MTELHSPLLRNVEFSFISRSRDYSLLLSPPGGIQGGSSCVLVVFKFAFFLQPVLHNTGPFSLIFLGTFMAE